MRGLARAAADPATDRSIAVVLGALAVAAYGALAGVLTVEDAYGRLAAAFLEGRWWLVDAPPWVGRVLACGEGRLCVAGPPLPAVLAMPFVPFVGTALAQMLVAQLFGGASAGVLHLALRGLGAPRLVAASGALVSAFGTALFFSSVDARADHAAHSVAVCFAAIALLVAARGGPAWAVGAAIGLAALARPPVAGAFPALALLAALRSGAPYGLVLRGVVLGGLPFAAAYAWYDLLRWGTPLDVGYARMAAGDVLFRYGLFSPVYVLRQLHAMLLTVPQIDPGVPWFILPRYAGMSLFLATPPFLWSVLALRRAGAEPVVRALALAAGLALLPGLLYGSVGAPQYGYRYSMDAQPFLVALAVIGAARTPAGWRRVPSAAFIAAAVVAIALGIYATIAIVHFRYWQ